jgi:hypothetical protein
VEDAIRKHGAKFDVDDELLQDLRTFLEVNNPLCQQYVAIGDAIRDINENNSQGPDAVGEGEPILSVKTHQFEVSAVLSEDVHGKRVVRVTPIGCQGLSKISAESSLFEPLCYPLLFCYGERGWGKDIRKSVTFQRYLASRILMPETFLDHNNQRHLIGHYSKINEIERFFPTNRFSLLSRVSQTYFVDQVSRIIDDRLQYQEEHEDEFKGVDKQEKDRLRSQRLHEKSKVEDDQNAHDHNERERGGNSRSFENDDAREEAQSGDSGDSDNSDHGGSDSDDSSDDDGDYDDYGRDGGGGDKRKSGPKYKKSFLSDSLHGSRRHLKKLAMNGLTVVSEMGSSDVFVTFTANTKWQELIAALPPGQTAYDNPSIVNRIFKKRLEAMLQNLRNGHYFGGRKTVYDIRVFEYQDRGLPHAHVVFKLADTNFDSEEEKIAFIDEHFSCKLPDPAVDLIGNS